MRAFGMGGMNVTIPHKQAVIPLLDEVDQSAAIGAVNTIVNRNGRLTGYNTDGIGYVRSLKEETGIDLSGKRIVILGAGGGARGLVYALCRERPARIVVANRTAEKAEKLAQDMSAFGPVEGGGMEHLPRHIAEADVLINTTSVGMAPQEGMSPVDADWLHSGLVVSDIIYNPMETALLRDAKEKGCTVHGGLGMLIHQGAYAFEYWTGVDAPVQAMREAVLEAMGLSGSGPVGSGAGR
jgi:shikimate dehydrogenase